jgi:hypothetical protein
VRRREGGGGRWRRFFMWSSNKGRRKGRKSIYF